MPAGGAWGTYNPYTYQQQHSTGRGWGPSSGRGPGSSWGSSQRPPQGGYQQPPMPYSGAGAWGQPQQGGGSQRPYGGPQRPPQRRGGGGGIGGGIGGRGIGGRGASAYDPTAGYNARQRKMQRYGMNEQMIDLMSHPFTRGTFIEAAGVPEQFQGAGADEFMSLMMQGTMPGWGSGVGGGYGTFGQGQNNPWMRGGY